MKKRNIVIISLSVVSLIFGGLVFLGVSTFPELLEEEKKETEHSNKEVLFNAPSNDNKKNDEAAVIVSSNAPSKYVHEGKDTFESSSRLSFKDSFTLVNYFEDRTSISIKEPISNKETITQAISEAKVPSTYYKGKSYVSLKRENENKDLITKQKVNQSEIIKNRNKNIVNAIVLVVVAIETLAFVFLNKKRHSHKA